MRQGGRSPRSCFDFADATLSMNGGERRFETAVLSIPHIALEHDWSMIALAGEEWGVLDRCVRQEADRTKGAQRGNTKSDRANLPRAAG